MANRPRRPTLARVISALALAGFLPTLADAQGLAPDPARGRDLAQRLCSGCHATGPPAKLADVPTFPVIANRPGRTPEFLTGAMFDPHPVMPGVPLTRQEARDLAAYILTFRKSE
jgi:cytochrome c